jgi:hypothetical protein
MATVAFYGQLGEQARFIDKSSLNGSAEVFPVTLAGRNADRQLRTAEELCQHTANNLAAIYASYQHGEDGYRSL